MMVIPLKHNILSPFTAFATPSGKCRYKKKFKKYSFIFCRSLKAQKSKQAEKAGKLQRKFWVSFYAKKRMNSIRNCKVYWTTYAS